MSPSTLMTRVAHWVCTTCGEVARAARQPSCCATCGCQDGRLEQASEVSLPSD
jgi:ABC-type ATPase with predicted acetyltransferase domain